MGPPPRRLHLDEGRPLIASAVWTVRRRGSTRQWRVRREWWATQIAAGATFVCPRCNQPILPGEPWHLDHYRDNDRDEDTLPAHADCNLQAGMTKQLARSHGLDVRDGRVVPGATRATRVASTPTATTSTARRPGLWGQHSAPDSNT